MNTRAFRRFELALPNDVYIINTTAFTPLSDINEWRTGRIDVATTTITLPKANGSGTEIWFALGIAATSVIIKTNGTDAFQGFIDIGVVGSTAKNVFTAGGLKNITLNGGTTGGSNVGDQIMFTDIKAAVWSVCSQVIGTGSPATPFS